MMSGLDSPVGVRWVQSGRRQWRFILTSKMELFVLLRPPIISRIARIVEPLSRLSNADMRITAALNAAQIGTIRL
jgi:hypothetical protein